VAPRIDKGNQPDADFAGPMDCRAGAGLTDFTKGFLFLYLFSENENPKTFLVSLLTFKVNLRLSIVLFTHCYHSGPDFAGVHFCAPFSSPWCWADNRSSRNTLACVRSAA
jgi:hypothetical protein